MNMEKEKFGSPDHECHIRARSRADITGVREVLSFDEGSVALVTSCGEMVVEGRDLRVGTLDTERGIVAVDGHISSVYYVDDSSKKKRGWFSRHTD